MLKKLRSLLFLSFIFCMPTRPTPGEVDEQWVQVCEMAAAWFHENVFLNLVQAAPHRPHIPDIGRAIRHNHLLHINFNHLALPATMLYCIQRSYNPNPL